MIVVIGRARCLDPCATADRLLVHCKLNVLAGNKTPAQRGLDSHSGDGDSVPSGSSS